MIINCEPDAVLRTDREEKIMTEVVQVKDNSEDRVAYDLMVLIANNERGVGTDKNTTLCEAQKNREYWLKLYYQSRKVVQGVKPENIL